MNSEIIHQAQPKLMGTGEETVRFMEENFNMSAIEFIALSAVHSVVQARATLGTKWVCCKISPP